MNDCLNMFVPKPCWYQDLIKEVPAVRRLPTVIKLRKIPDIEKEIRHLPSLADKLKEWGIC